MHTHHQGGVAARFEQRSSGEDKHVAYRECPVRQWGNTTQGGSLQSRPESKSHSIKPGRTRGSKEVDLVMLWFSSSLALQGKLHRCSGFVDSNRSCGWTVLYNFAQERMGRCHSRTEGRRPEQRWGHRNQDYYSKQRKICECYENPSKTVQVCSTGHFIKRSQRFP